MSEEKPASSSEFDEAAAQKKSLELADKNRGRESDSCLWGNIEMMEIARWQHARDAEEIKQLKEQVSYLVDLVRAQNCTAVTYYKSNDKFTEENQRLRDDLAHANETCETFSDENAEWKLRIEKLEKETVRLNRVILKELTENDELGCEYTYVNALRESNRKLTAALKSLRHAIVGHKGNGEVIPMIDEALAADGGEK